MAAPAAYRGFLDDPSKQSSPVARPPRNPAPVLTSPPSAGEPPAATAHPVGDAPAAAAAAAAAEEACAETTQRLFKLNVVAVECFPPPTFQTMGTTAWNVDAAEFHPARREGAGRWHRRPSAGIALLPERGGRVRGQRTVWRHMAENNDMEVMLRAHDKLAELARDPASLKHLSRWLITDLYPLVGANERALQNLADVIVDYAESFPNVSYTAARLCANLNESGIGGSTYAFRRCLLQKCAKTSKKLQSARGSPKRQLFTIFLAELFVAIVIPLDNATDSANHVAGVQMVKSDALSKGVKKLMMALLDGGCDEEQPSDDELKCVAKVLKLCGWELSCFERDNPLSSSSTSLASTSTTTVTSSFSSSSGEASPSVTDVLKALRSRRDRSGALCQWLIDRVFALEASGWDRSQSATDIAAAAPTAMQAGAVPSAEQYQQLPFQCEPVFYSKDGRQITRRDAGFADFEEDELQPDVYDYGGSTGQDYASGGGDVCEGSAAYYDDPELNDEICEAFKAFCEQNATASREQQFQSKFS